MKKQLVLPALILGIALVIASYVLRYNYSKSPPPQLITPSPTLVSSADVFQLRSKCVVLGQKILDNNVIGNALTQSQVSYYNPATNRCNVQLIVQSIITNSGSLGDYFSNSLYDGQTGELLAFATKEKGKKDFGQIFSGDSSGYGFGYSAASDYIYKVMNDDRKQ